VTRRAAARARRVLRIGHPLTGRASGRGVQDTFCESSTLGVQVELQNHSRSLPQVQGRTADAHTQTLT
jgi:hypothetical protein